MEEILLDDFYQELLMFENEYFETLLVFRGDVVNKALQE